MKKNVVISFLDMRLMLSNFFYKQQIVKIPDSTILYIKATSGGAGGVGGGSFKKFPGPPFL